MPNAAYVSTGKPKISGAVYRAPLGTALPTDATSPLDLAFAELGYVSEDGVTNNNSPSSDNIAAWGGEVVLTVQSEKPDEWTLTFIEAINPNVLKTVYGDENVAVGDGGKITVTAKADQDTEHVYVIDMALKGGAKKRVLIPYGVIKETGEVVYKDDEPIGYEVTLSALPSGSGSTAYTHQEFIQPAVAPTSANTTGSSTGDLSNPEGES